MRGLGWWSFWPGVGWAGRGGGSSSRLRGVLGQRGRAVRGGGGGRRGGRGGRGGDGEDEVVRVAFLALGEGIVEERGDELECLKQGTVYIYSDLGSG